MHTLKVYEGHEVGMCVHGRHHRWIDLENELMCEKFSWEQYLPLTMSTLIAHMHFRIKLIFTAAINYKYLVAVTIVTKISTPNCGIAREGC